MQNTTISILGGGIAGLSSAIALKLKGFDVDVYEREKQPTDIGAGIVCWPNASFVLSELGMLEQIRKVSGEPVRMDRISDDEEPLGSLDIRELNKQMGYGSYSILRRDLMNIIVARANELGIEIHYSHELTSLNFDSDKYALAEFKNGKNIKADALIGADGRMNSIARTFICENNQPIYQGFINWVGVFECNQPVFEEIAVSDYWGTGERFGVVPISATRAYWAGGVAAPEIGERNPGDYKDELLKLFRDWPNLIPRIITETPVDKINKIYVHDHDPTETWHKGNLLMIGDAAHAPLPTSGQGACQALEDAWHLANLLEQNSEVTEVVFRKFTELRQAKTAGIILGARQLAASLFNTEQDYCSQRNQRSKETDYSTAVLGMARGWASGLPIGPQVY